MGPVPSKNWRMLVAIVVAITRGTKERPRNSNRSSSMARMTPAIGVLNVAAIPAPAPHARNNLSNHRAERSAGLNDGPFGAKRAAGAYCDSGREGLEECHLGFDTAL